MNGLSKALAAAVVAACAVAASEARAESFYLVQGDIHAMNLIDMDSVKRSGDTSKVWEAVAYAAPADKTYSARTQLEFDCKAAKVRTVQATQYDMGDAVVGQTAAATDWAPVDAGSLMASYARFACGKGRPAPAASMDDKLASIARNYRKAVASGAVK